MSEVGPWYRLPFGRYKGEMLSNLLLKNEKYFKWLAEGNADNLLPTHAKAYIRHAAGAIHICSGRYKGLTYAELHDCHQGYFEWLLQTPGNEWMKRLFS